MNSTKEKEPKPNNKRFNNKSIKSNNKKSKTPPETKSNRSSSLRGAAVNNKTPLNPSNNVKSKEDLLNSKPTHPLPGYENAPKFERSNSFSLTRHLSKLITSITGSKENLSKTDEAESPYKFTRSRSMILLRRTNRRSVIEPQLEQLSEETEKSVDQPDSIVKTPEVVKEEEEVEFRKPAEPPSAAYNPQEHFQKRRSSSFIASFRRTLTSATEKKKPLNPKWSASLQSLQAIDNMVSYENMKFIDYDKFHDYEKNLERRLSTAHLDTAPDVATPPAPPPVVRRPKKTHSNASTRSRPQLTQSAIFDSDFEHNLDRPKNLYRFSLDSRKLERLNKFLGGSMPIVLDSKLDALNLEDGSIVKRRRPVSFYIGSLDTLRRSRSKSDVVDAGAAIQVSFIEYVLRS